MEGRVQSLLSSVLNKKHKVQHGWSRGDEFEGAGGVREG